MKALTCHSDKTSLMANIVGWRRMDWSRMESRGCSKKRVCSPTQPEELSLCALGAKP